MGINLLKNVLVGIAQMSRSAQKTHISQLLHPHGVGSGQFAKQFVARKCMIYQDLYRKLMFSKPHLSGDGGQCFMENPRASSWA